MTSAEPAPPAERFTDRLREELLRRPVRLAAACAVTLLGGTAVAFADAGEPASAVSAPAPARPPTAVVEFPLPGDPASWRAPAQRAAATCPGLPADVLVAIAQVETRFGHRTGISSAGARGPMQFLPSTWAAYGVDGDGDGHADVLNAVDALHGAARLLCANGGSDPARLDSALWNYNHSDHYVRQVLAMAWLSRSAA